MTKRAHRLVLAAAAAVSALLLGLFLIAAPDPATAPRDAPGMVRWLASHPADWLVASELTDRALDAKFERRREVWRAAHALAQRLAPAHGNANAALLRSGLFHWYELDANDRKAVLDAAAPLLRDPAVFRDLHRPLFQLTRDFDLLRRSNPGDASSLRALRDLAVANGLFDEYRDLRERVPAAELAEFQSRRAELSTYDILPLIPSPIHKRDEALVAAILDELGKRSDVPASDVVAQLREYAARHGLPGAGNAARAPASPRLEWRGPCAPADLCPALTADLTMAAPLTLDLRTIESDDIPPWIEVYADDALVAEGDVRESRSFRVDAQPGPRHLEVRIANPRMRDGRQRRARVELGK